MDNQVDIDFLKSVYQRRKKILYSLFSLILIATMLVAFFLPPVYRSQVGILIEEQQIPENYVQSTITSYVEERIEMITKQVMSRSKLLDIIQKYKLYEDLNNRYTESEILSEMRENIELETMTADVGKRNSVTIGFTLSYSGRNPEKLRSVANELAYLYLEEEHKSKEKMASITTDFLQQELNSFKEQIEYAEERLSIFKQEHTGELPQNFASNSSTLDRFEREYDRMETNIRSLEERKVFLKTQIANVEPLTPIFVDGKNVMMNPAERLKRLRLELISKRSVYSDKHPDIQKLQKEIAELESQVGDQDSSVDKVKILADLQGRLSALKGRLGEKHPDVIQLQKEYETLSDEVDGLMTSQIASDVGETKPDNPAYINLMTQIVTIDSQIKGYREDQEKLKKQIAIYQKRIENSPLIETEYNELTRDRVTNEKKYNELLSKLMQAKVAQGMESSQRGERFAISEPASYPDKPYKPNRKIIMIIGLLLAISVSVGITAIQETIDVSVKSIKDVGIYAGIPVFSVFPLIQTAEEKRKKKIKSYICSLVVVILICVSVIIVDQVVMPLDVIWSKTLNRLIDIGLPLDTLIESNQ